MWFYEIKDVTIPLSTIKAKIDKIITTLFLSVFWLIGFLYDLIGWKILSLEGIRATISTPNRLNRKPNQKPSEGLLFFSLAMYLPIAPVMNLKKNIETNKYSIRLKK